MECGWVFSARRRYAGRHIPGPGERTFHGDQDHEPAAPARRPPAGVNGMGMARFWLALARAERLPLIWLVGLAAIAGIGWFAGTLALVESAGMRLAIISGGARLLADVVLVLFAVLVPARARDTRLWLLWRAAPAGPGRVAGGAALALWLIAAGFAATTLPILILAGAPPAGAGLFALGLMLEAGLVGQMALALGLALRGPLAGFVAGLLALLFGRLAGIFGGAVAATAGEGWSRIYEIAALVVPRLDLYADPALLTGGGAFPLLALIQAPAYAALFLALAVIEGWRR